MILKYARIKQQQQKNNKQQPKMMWRATATARTITWFVYLTILCIWLRVHIQTLGKGKCIYKNVCIYGDQRMCATRKLSDFQLYIMQPHTHTLTYTRKQSANDFHADWRAFHNRTTLYLHIIRCTHAYQAASVSSTQRRDFYSPDDVVCDHIITTMKSSSGYAEELHTRFY